VSDDFNTSQPGVSPPSVEMPAKKPGLLASTGGKVVAIFIGLGAIAAIVGIIAMIFLFVLKPGDADKFEVVEQTPQSSTTGSGDPAGSTTSTAPVAAAPAKPADPVANKEVFTFRDIFEPLLKEIAAETPATGGESVTDTETPMAENVLYVTDIVSEDGELKVVATLNGQSYTLGEGESIPGTPWKVLRITSTQVTFLYGDVLVYLSIGQGITK
jgi:hypothetical protein